MKTPPKPAAREAVKPQGIQQKSVRRKRDKEVSQHLAEVGAAVRLSQEPSDEGRTAEFRCVGTPACTRDG